jgi:conjugal transfer pilus assembly protein TraB
VVDRSSEVARESLIAGILSGMSQFLKFDASNSAYPLTPFIQPPAMGTTKALQGAAGSGASNALEKLADFSIKRAEQMQPVLMVASGRVVDVVFKKGVDLSPLPLEGELTLIKDTAGPAESSPDQQNEASHDD